MSNETIDVTPTWEALIPAMVQVLRNPKAEPQSVRDITEELIRLARIVDQQNENNKKIAPTFGDKNDPLI